MALSLQAGIPPFDVHGDSESCGKRWTTWLSRFNIYLQAAAITAPGQKKALLLHCAGDEVQDIFTAIPNSETITTYEAATTALSDHFAPKRNVDYEVFKFRQAKQGDLETVDSFHLRLRQLAVGCEFHNMDTEIKAQILHTCKSSSLRMRALAETNLTLEKLLNMARIMEMSESQAKDMEISSKQEYSSVNRIHTGANAKQKWNGNSFASRKYTSQPKEIKGNLCRKCGYEYPHAKGPLSCPARQKVCHSCSKIGHYSRCCLSKPVSQKSGSNKGKRGQVSTMTAKEDTDSKSTYRSDSPDEFLFSLAIGQGQPKINLIIANKEIQMVMDTGASVNIIGEQDYNKIADTVNLENTKVNIFPYGSTVPLKLKGTFTTKIEYKKGATQTTAQFYVVKEIRGAETISLLSYPTLQELGLCTNRIHSIKTNHEIEEEFSDLFHGAGKMTKFQVELHIDKTVVPVAKQHRRVPFHLRKALEIELDKLLADDIIEPISGPTPWVSPVVIVPKDEKGEEIRLCVDMREPNKAIQRERHVMPTLDDIMQDLNGAQFFTKLDLKKGYHQIELKPESRYITVFSTHKGLFQYKRLSFGISSAAEVFQNIITNIISDVPGSLNTSDDILVYGVTEKDHDRNLRLTLKRIRENNLKLNK